VARVSCTGTRKDGYSRSDVALPWRDIVPKVSQEPLFLDRLHERRKLTKDEISFICVPLAIGSEVVGTLSADRLFDGSAELAEDLRVLSIVAGMIAYGVQARRHAVPRRDRRLLAGHAGEAPASASGPPVRLENCIERAVLLTTDGVIHGHHLPPTLQTSEASDTIGTGPLKERVALFEHDVIVDALKRSFGNVSTAARDPRTTARMLSYRIKKRRIDPKRFARRG